MDLLICEYSLHDSLWFKKVKEANGMFSNMYGSPVRVNGLTIPTSEALFQACRFPDYPEAQRDIINQKTPMSAKMKAKSYKKMGYTRTDWGDDNTNTEENNLRIEVMRWCLRVKLASNFSAFSALLLKNKTFPIVENAPTIRHTFWGAYPVAGNETVLRGQNILGKLLMELRQEFLEELEKKNARAFLQVEAPDISNFKLYGVEIMSIDMRKM